jgi:hypothetical protein
MDAVGEEIDRVVAAPMFPFEGEMRLKEPPAPVAVEPARAGEGDRPCGRCADPERGVIWSSGRFVVTSGPRTALPVTVFIESRAHLDIDGLDEDAASELGRLIVALEGAVREVPGVGRVHVHRWADGSAHFHLWFMARPLGHVEMFGWGTELWSQVLPPTDEAAHAANLEIVAGALAVRLGPPVS